MPILEATSEPFKPNVTFKKDITSKLSLKSSSTKQTKDIAKYDIKGDVTIANIINRKRTQKQQAYITVIKHLNKLLSFYTIIAAASYYITARFY
jgi:hypothetical protein